MLVATSPEAEDRHPSGVVCKRHATLRTNFDLFTVCSRTSSTPTPFTNHEPRCSLPTLYHHSTVKSARPPRPRGDWHNRRRRWRLKRRRRHSLRVRYSNPRRRASAKPYDQLCRDQARRASWGISSRASKGSSSVRQRQRLQRLRERRRLRLCRSRTRRRVRWRRLSRKGRGTQIS